MEPPGKLSGFTTKLSVVMAIRAPPMSREAASSRGSVGGAKQKRSEQAFDQSTAGDASGAVRHFDLRLAKVDLGWRLAGYGVRLHAGHASLVAIAFRCS